MAGPIIFNTTLVDMLRKFVSRVLGVYPFGQYNAVDPVLTEDQAVMLRVDQAGKLLTGQQTVVVTFPGGTWVPAVAAAPANSGVIRNVATTAFQTMASNSHATITYYLMLFDLAAVPANGTAPRLPVVTLPAGQAIVVPHGLNGLACAHGWVWAASTTIATLTQAATSPLQVSSEVT